MYKKLLQFKTFLIVCLLAMVGNSAWAQSTSTLTFSANCNGSGTADDEVAWTVTSDGSESNFDSSKGIHYGTGSQHVQYIKLSTSQIVGTITRVVVNASTASGVSATVGVTVGGVAFGGNPQSLSTSAANYTFNGSASGEIVVTVTKPSKAAKALYVKSVAVTYTSGGTSTLTDNDLALTDDPVALSFDLYNNVTPQVISYTTSSTGAVTIADNDYATFVVDQTNKTITVTPTAETPSTQTITVIQAPDKTYAAGSVTFTLDVIDSTPTVGGWVETALADLTADDVFVIVGANSTSTYAMSNGNGTTSAPSAVKVTVTDDEITSKVTDDIKWTISGDATNGYTFYPAGSTKSWLYCINDNNGVRVGIGEAKRFTLSKNGYLTTTETTDQRYLGIYNQTDWRCYKSEGGNIADQTFKFFRLVDPTLPRLTVSDVNVDLDYNATSGSISYTLVNPVSGGEVTATSSESWLTPGTVTATEVPFTCTANEANTERTATVTLTYTYGDNETVTKDVTVTQAEYVVIKTYSIATSITSGKHYIITNGSAKAMETQTKNNRAAVDVTTEDNVVTVANSDVTEFVIYGPDADGYYSIYDEKERGFLYAASSSSNYLRTQTTNNDNGLWTISFKGDGHAVITAKGANTHNVMQFNSNSDLFSCYEDANQSAVSLYEKDGEDIPTENKTLNAYGYATYCSQNALDFSDDSEVTAWAISEANSTTGVITFTQITGKAAAGTGMLLKGEANASVTLTSASGKDDLTNLLIGTTKAHTVLNKGDYYGLSGNTFVPVNAGTVPAGKALLPSDRLTSGSGEVRAYTFVFVDPTTGISETQTVSAEQFGEIFNLAGQRIGQPQKGVNIINGKKVLVK